MSRRQVIAGVFVVVAVAASAQTAGAANSNSHSPDDTRSSYIDDALGTGVKSGYQLLSIDHQI